MSYSWIRASEIGQYAYCRRAWWLRRVGGVKPQNVHQLQRGAHFHRQHGRKVEGAIWSRRLALAIIFVAVAFLVFQLLGGL
jgi:hypothetical protein